MPFPAYIPKKDQEWIKTLFKKSINIRIPYWLIFLLITTILAFYPAWHPIMQEKLSDMKAVTLQEEAEVLSGSDDIQFKKISDENKKGTETGCIEIVEGDKIRKEYEIENMDEVNKYYYPYSVGGSIEGMLWVPKVLKTNFKTINIKYNIKTDDFTQPPSLIWVLVRPLDKDNNETLAKLWIPEYSRNNDSIIPQLVGLASVLDGVTGDFERDEAIEIHDPVKRNQIDTLQITNADINGSEMTLNFKYSYISDRTGVAPNPFPFTKIIKLPISNTINAPDFLDFGVGTYVGNGIKIISMDICY